MNLSTGRGSQVNVKYVNVKSIYALKGLRLPLWSLKVRNICKDLLKLFTGICAYKIAMITSP